MRTAFLIGPGGAEPRRGGSVPGLLLATDGNPLRFSLVTLLLLGSNRHGGSPFCQTRLLRFLTGEREEFAVPSGTKSKLRKPVESCLN